MSITFEPVPEQAPVTTIDVPVAIPPEPEADRREILLKAAEAIETHGWTTGVAGMLVDGPFCLLGAIAHAAGHKPYVDLEDAPASYDMAEASYVLGVDTTDAYGWNDTLCLNLPMRRKHLFAKKELIGGEEVVALVLRRMANGTDWNEAIRF